MRANEACNLDGSNSRDAASASPPSLPPFPHVSPPPRRSGPRNALVNWRGKYLRSRSKTGTFREGKRRFWRLPLESKRPITAPDWLASPHAGAKQSVPPARRWLSVDAATARSGLIVFLFPFFFFYAGGWREQRQRRVR